MNAFFLHKFSSSFFVWFVATCRKRNAAVRMRGLNENINIFNKKRRADHKESDIIIALLLANNKKIYKIYIKILYKIKEVHSFVVVLLVDAGRWVFFSYFFQFLFLLVYKSGVKCNRKNRNVNCLWTINL